jgi:zinc transport system ATP-binding protein
MKTLSVKNLNVNLGGQNIIDDLSFDIETGENLAIIGPNGSGKTVLLRALLGSVPYAGEISWAADTRIGYVPQKIDADRHLPINLKNLLHAKAGVLGVKNFHDKMAAEEVGLPASSLVIPIGHLSGGQFQRALIAFALLGHPSVLLLDEPTASIDVAGEEQVYELLHRLQGKYDITLIVVSHDLSFVYKYANKVLCLNKAGLCFGAPEETLNNQILEKLYGPHKYFHHYHHKEN